MQGTSWIALRAPDDEKGADSNLGDTHGDDVLESGPSDPPAGEASPAGDETPSDPPAAGDTPPPPAETPSDPPAHKADWRDKELTRRKRRLDEEVAAREALAAENQRLKDLAESIARQQQPEGDETPPRQPNGGERSYTRAELEAEAARMAEQRAQQLDFQRTFNNIYQKASGTYGKANVDASIARISEMGGLDVDHLNMVMATDNPEKVLYELGSKPEEFQRIMELPFNRRVAELVKMGLKTEAKQPVISRTPAPVDPISGNGGPVDNRYSDKVSDNDWFQAEERRAEERWKKKNAEWRR
jgi:hypothetical protein